MIQDFVRIELAGTENVMIGIHQAIKYRSLAAAESSIPLDARDDLAAYVVAYDTGGTQAAELAEAYNVRLHAVDREVVLAPGE